MLLLLTDGRLILIIPTSTRDRLVVLVLVLVRALIRNARPSIRDIRVASDAVANAGGISCL